MSRTRIKICGITRPADALAVVEAGADALGLVFYPPSPRAVNAQTAAGIVAGLPPLVTRVGLFVNAEPAEVGAICDTVPLDLLQFHGDEDDAWCGQFGMPYMKAIRVGSESDVSAEMERWPGAAAILLDTYRSGTPGGTGEVFDWDQVPARSERPLVLAGGLGPGNVAEAIARTSPYAVDVSGGVESGPGVKDHALVREFVRAVSTANTH